MNKEEILDKIKSLFGSSKHKTTDEQLHIAGEKVIEQLDKKFNEKDKTQNKWFNE